MNFIYGSFSLFQNIETMRPHLRAELGQYVLEFDLRFTSNNPHPRNGGLVIDDLRINVLLKNTQQIIGVSEPAVVNGNPNVITIRPQARQMDASVKFHLFLTPALLEAMEEHRNGGNLDLTLRMSGIVTGYDSNEHEKAASFDLTWSGENLWNAAPARVYAPRRCFQDCQLTLSQSDWIDLLARAGCSKTIFLEIPTPAADELGAASTHVQDAQAAFSQGRYADVVARCRDAMDTLIKKSGYPWSKLADQGWREDMTVEDRLRLGWIALRHVTHPSHHRNGTKSEFTRPMAQYVLGATYLTLSLACRERDLFTAPRKEASSEQEG